MFRIILAVWLGKIIFFLTRLLKKGGGSAAPGYYALKICPGLVSSLVSQIPQNIVITGTNGKTTTARLLSQFVADQKLKVLRNSTGSNLERGIASALISRANLWGKIETTDLGIWEVDEAAFNDVVFKTKPQIITFLNAFRDQLDRYGEVDTVVDNWRKSLNKIGWNPTILTNTGNKNTAWIESYQDKNIYGFQVKNHFVRDERAGDYPELSGKDDFSAKIIKNLGLKGTDLDLSYPAGKLHISFPVPGIYHVYDLLAAFGTYYLLNLPVEGVKSSLKTFKPAFGRVEKLSINGSEGYILLIKNPAGANSVFETLKPELKSQDKILIALNDNFADGTDVSWIWDTRFEELQITNYKLQIICSGTRAEELAVRLKYAGFDTKQIEVQSNIEQAFKNAAKGLPGKLFILPTYTALLELQKILAGQRIKSLYWKES